VFGDSILRELLTNIAIKTSKYLDGVLCVMNDKFRDGTSKSNVRTFRCSAALLDAI
jgi:hypothetical protein